MADAPRAITVEFLDILIDFLIIIIFKFIINAVRDYTGIIQIYTKY